MGNGINTMAHHVWVHPLWWPRAGKRAQNPTIAAHLKCPSIINVRSKMARHP